MTDLTVTPANKEALSIKAPTASLHSTFTYDSQGGLLIHNKATLVKSGDTPLFELAKATTSESPHTEPAQPADPTTGGNQNEDHLGV